MVEDTRIRCHKTTGHGPETFVDAIKNSCNPVFMQLGLRIPRDLALMTFDRYPFSQLLIPRLTAVEVDMFDMGWEAARFLVQKIKKPGLQVQTFCTTPRLLEGQST